MSVKYKTLNSISYREYEKELDEILAELGYDNHIVRRSNYREFAGFRIAPTNGTIKVYHGGQGRSK